MNRKRIIIIAVVVTLLLVAILTRGFGLFGNEDDKTLTLYGNVDIREVDLGFRVGGRIESIAVEEGEKVKAGELLATLDRASLESRASQADAEIAAAQANLTRLRNGNRPQDIAQARARLAVICGIKPLPRVTAQERKQQRRARHYHCSNRVHDARILRPQRRRWKWPRHSGAERRLIFPIRDCLPAATER